MAGESGEWGKGLAGWVSTEVETLGSGATGPWTFRGWFAAETTGAADGPQPFAQEPSGCSESALITRHWLSGPGMNLSSIPPLYPPISSGASLF